MLATPGRPFDSPRHLFDAKWDGLRTIGFFGPFVRLQARSLRDRTAQFPDLVEAFGTLPGDGVLDGEIVVLEEGRASFPLVMERNRLSPAAARRRAPGLPAWFVAFDLPFVGGARLVGLPFSERRRRLEALLSRRPHDRILLNPCVSGDGTGFLGEMRGRGLEGMVAKERDSRYRPGERSDAWIKIKLRPRAACAVFGTVHRSEGGPVRSLVVGAYGEDGPVWLGNVGSGLDEATRAAAGSALDRHAAPPPPGFRAEADGHVRYLRPLLVALVEYLEVTPSGRLRHPTFLGFVDRDPKACRPPRRPPGPVAGFRSD